MSRADDLAATLRQLAADEEDFLLADALLEAVQSVERVRDGKLRDQVQGVVGKTEFAIQDRLDVLLNIGRDTHQLVMAVQGEQIAQGAAVGALRAEFHERFQEVGEHVSELRADLDALSERDAKQHAAGMHDRKQITARLMRIEATLAERPSLEETARLIERADADHARLAAIEAETQHLASLLAARPSPAHAAATYAGVQRILDHLGLTLADDGDDDGDESR